MVQPNTRNKETTTIGKLADKETKTIREKNDTKIQEM